MAVDKEANSLQYRESTLSILIVTCAYPMCIARLS